MSNYPTRTGYYVREHGGLREVRHAHSINGEHGWDLWHLASTPHPEAPDAHTNARSWLPFEVVWAHANDGYTREEKAFMIENAQLCHDLKLKNSSLDKPNTPHFNRNGTGYYYNNGNLRHAHDYHTSEGIVKLWHDADTVHLDDPDAHTLSNAWDRCAARWAKANMDIPANVRGQLILDAKRKHDTRYYI